MEWTQLLSDRRFGATTTERTPSHRLFRSEYERDYDRLVFSPAFRRLQNKTQVFPLPGTIFVHNRLTHSLEVSCLGRSLGHLVSDVLQQRHPQLQAAPYRGAISAIVSAACLAHDLGNPPFGHSGERAIRAYFTEGNGQQRKEQVVQEGGRWEDFVYFEGNANALRLLTHQFKGRRAGGFALTYATLASIIKYPYTSLEAKESGKFGYFITEDATMRELAKQLGLRPRATASQGYSRHPLVYLVEAADDICYQVMDIEDAYKLKLLSLHETTELLEAFFSESELDSLRQVKRTIGDPHEQIGYLRSKVINLLVEECASLFLDSETSLLHGDLNGTLISALPPRQRQAYQACSDTAISKIYRSQAVVDMDLAGQKIFTALLDQLIEALFQPTHLYSRTLLSRVSSQYETEQVSAYGKIQCALDYISGMTDIYALDLYRRITGLNLPAV